MSSALSTVLLPIIKYSIIQGEFCSILAQNNLKNRFWERSMDSAPPSWLSSCSLSITVPQFKQILTLTSPWPSRNCCFL